MPEKIATRDAYGETLIELARERKDIVVLDADLSKSTKTFKFSTLFPDRFFNMGIAEADMVGTAAGLATAGKIPFVSTFAVFATGRVYDQIRNSVAYPCLNVKIVATHGGITVGEDGASHQALEDIALMRALPNMGVIVPADGPETVRAVRAVAEYNGPVYLRLGRPKVPVVTSPHVPFEVGKGTVMRQGEDITIVATGIMVNAALEAADILQSEGIFARVLNIHTIKPLDEALLIKAAMETKAVVTVEEHSVIGGLGSAVAEFLGENKPVLLKRLGIPDCFGESGSPESLLEKYGLTPRDIVDTARFLLQKKNC